MMNVLHILVVATPVLKNKLRRSCIYFFPYYFMHSSKMIIYSSTHYHHQPWERYHLYASMAFWAGHLQVIIRHFTHTQDILFLFYIYTQYIFTDYFPSLLSLESSMMNGEIYIINIFFFFFCIFRSTHITNFLNSQSRLFKKEKKRILKTDGAWWLYHPAGDVRSRMREEQLSKNKKRERRAERAVLIDVRERDAILIDLLDDRLIPRL